jgi:hypothetical protein
MRSIRRLAAARRVLAASVAASGLAIGLAASAPAAHAGPICWAPITLVNGWHSEQSVYNTGDPSVCLENDGMVYLSGSVAAPDPGSYSEFGILPVWDWPTQELYFDVYTLNGTYGVLRIDIDGTMWAYGGSGGTRGFTSLAGVSYPDAAVSPTDMTLKNGWQSADSIYGTGDPAYSVTSGVVHLAGSLRRPAGPAQPGTGQNVATSLPAQVQPPDSCFSTASYTYGGGLHELGIAPYSGDVFGTLDSNYTGLAGINYPAYGAPWQALTLLHGFTDNLCNTGPAFVIIGNVVYLTGFISLSLSPLGFNGEIAVLPSAARPSHTLYMTAWNDGPGANYATLRIEPSGAMYIFNPHGGVVFDAGLAGLSFHLGS